jgi:TolA-binding protein
VVKIASKDLNKDLSGYIGKRRSRRRGKLFGWNKAVAIKPAKPKSAEISPDVEVEYKKPGIISKVFSFRRRLVKDAEQSEDLTPEEMAKLKGMEDDIEETEEQIVQKEDEVRELQQEEEVLVERRESQLSNFFNKINFLKKKQQAQAEPAQEDNGKYEPVLDEDVIEVIKICHKWLNELPPGKKRSFKASSDFQKYKEVLEKYGLVKQKKEE